MHKKKRFITLLSTGMLASVVITTTLVANENIYLQQAIANVTNDSHLSQWFRKTGIRPQQEDARMAFNAPVQKGYYTPPGDQYGYDQYGYDQDGYNQDGTARWIIDAMTK